MLAWIEQLPPAKREIVAAEYAPPDWRSPAEMVMAISQVPDAIVRDQLLRGIVRHDQTALVVASAIDKAPLSPEQRKYLLEIVLTEAKNLKSQGSEK